MTTPQAVAITLHHPWLERAFQREPDDVGAAALQLWEHLATQLVSIIGEAGFESLYSRCVFLLRDDFPWLQLSRSSTQIGTRFTALQSQLNQEDLATAERACRAMFDTFVGLLSGLIGPALTHNILHAAWEEILPSVEIVDYQNDLGSDPIET